MRSDNLSEQERLRLARLLKAPLIARPKPPQWHLTIQWPKWNGWLAGMTNHVKGHWRAWTTGGATAVACCLLLAVGVRFGRRDDTSTKLQVLESQGQLRIRWDTESNLVQRATGAKLFITDGSEHLFVMLDSQRLRRGMVSYARQSERVELRLVLAEPDGGAVEQKAVFFGAPPSQERVPQLSADSGPATNTPSITVEVKPVEPAGVIEHRSRSKPLVHSGTRLPFLCAPGDVFHKTDAPPGWDTFTCKGKNVWSLGPTQAGASGSGQGPNANAHTVTVQPATASTT